MRGKFSTATTVTIRGISRFTCFESLQANNKHKGSLVNLKSLCCLNMIFALRTIPLVVFIKLFWLREFFQAVTKSNGATSFFRLLATFLDILIKRFSSLEMLKVFRGHLQIPDNLKDQIVLTSLISVKVRVETDIRVNTYLSHEIVVSGRFSKWHGAAVAFAIATEMTSFHIACHVLDSQRVNCLLN